MAATCGENSCSTNKPSDLTPKLEVDVIFACPNEMDTETTECLFSVLDESEKQRLKLFRDSSAQRQYLVAHVLLRAGLSARYPVEPSTWKFAKTHSGQPYVSHPDKLPNLSFSLSHTGSLVACAFTQKVRIGIDIEKIDTIVDIHDLAPHILSNFEYTWWQREPTNNQTRRFYQLWTIKESLLKALGYGLAVAPSQLCIQLQDKAAPKLLDLPQELGSCEHWAFHLIQPTGFHINALAVNVSPGNRLHINYSYITIKMLHSIVCGKWFQHT